MAHNTLLTRTLLSCTLGLAAATAFAGLPLTPRPPSPTAVPGEPGGFNWMLVDRVQKLLYAAHDNGAEDWVINAKTEKLVGAIPIPSAPEAFAYDAATDTLSQKHQARRRCGRD